MGGCISKAGHGTLRHGQGQKPCEDEPGLPALRASPADATQAFQQLSARQRGAASPSTSHDLPRRALAKFDALAHVASQGRSSEAGALLGYAARTLEFAASNQQPDLEMARLDVQHMPSLIAAYNSRHPGLNASHFDTPRAFVDALAEDQRPAWRGVMRLVEGQIHHVAVDVRRHGRKRSVIVMEPAVVFSPGPTPDYLALAKTLGKKASWALIEVNAQKSLSDCLMYALHFTLLAHRGSAPRGSSQAVPGLFERWHENLARYGRLGGPEDDPARFDPVPDETLRKAGLMLHEGMDVLPSAFYKHAQSKATAMAFERRRPEIAASDVRTGRGAEPESLVDRAEAFRVQRSGGRSFSTSIEAARATKIRNALLDVGGSD